jgi:hypothetical protein
MKCRLAIAMQNGLPNIKVASQEPEFISSGYRVFLPEEKWSLKKAVKNFSTGSFGFYKKNNPAESSKLVDLIDPDHEDSFLAIETCENLDLNGSMSYITRVSRDYEGLDAIGFEYESYYYGHPKIHLVVCSAATQDRHKSRVLHHGISEFLKKTGIIADSEIAAKFTSLEYSHNLFD